MLINGHVQHQGDSVAKSISLLSDILKISRAESQRRADPSFRGPLSLLPHCGFSPESRNAGVQQLISMVARPLQLAR